MSQSLLAQSRANQLYYYKQAPPQNYFSPGAWIQFLEAWKRGDYKKKPNQKSQHTFHRIDSIGFSPRLLPALGIPY